MCTSSAFDLSEASDIWFCRTFSKLSYLSNERFHVCYSSSRTRFWFFCKAEFVKHSQFSSSDDLLESVEFLQCSSVFVFYIRGRRQCAAEAVWLSATLFLPLNPLSKGRCHCNVPEHHQHCTVRAPTRLSSVWMNLSVSVLCTLYTTTRTTPYHFPFYIGPALFCTALLDCIELLNSNVLFGRSPLICPSLPHRENKTRILWTSF